MAAVRDISDRKKADAELYRMAAIIECSDDAILGKAPDGIITSWNPAAVRLYGYSAEEAMGKSAAFLVPPGHRDDVADILARVGRGEKVEHYETSRLHKDGRVIDVSVSAAPILDSRGALVGVSTIARDITDRKQAEAAIFTLNAELEDRVAQRTAELAEAVEELEAFSYSVSHDLRAPLRHVDGFSRILLDEYGDVLDAEGQRLLTVIRRATSHMGNLIDDLLEFSRVGRLPVQTGDLDMGMLWGSVSRELAGTYPDRDVQITMGQVPSAQGDRALIRQVLINLLSNAIKYTGQCATARIDISGWVDGGECVYSVQDNGVGFDKTYEEKLFQVFQRLHSTEFEGTGVGLALVQRIVHRHGGRVWADGAVGEGATFWFTLPAPKRATT